MILETDKVRLRPFRREDLDTFYAWRSDPPTRFLALMHPYPVSYEQEQAWLEGVLTDRSNRSLYFAAETADNSRLFGYFNLKDINAHHRHAFLGIVIGEEGQRGKGLGTEVMTLGLAYGFHQLGLAKISLEVLPENDRAVRLYERLGFIQEGTFHRHFFFGGRFHDVLRMALFRENAPAVANITF